jgi:hypothetical protein
MRVTKAVLKYLACTYKIEIEIHSDQIGIKKQRVFLLKTLLKHMLLFYQAVLTCICLTARLFCMTLLTAH